MTGREEIEHALHQFVADELLNGDAGDLTPATNLLALGVIDSLSMLSLWTFIERTFAVHLPQTITAEDVASVSKMVAIVERQQRLTVAEPKT